MSAVGTPDFNTIWLPHTYAWSGAAAVASGATSYLPPFFMPVPPGQTATLVGVWTLCRAGSMTGHIQQSQNAGALTTVAGLDSLTFSQTSAFFACSGWQEVFDGDYFAPVLDSVASTPDGFTVTFVVAYQLDPAFV